MTDTIATDSPFTEDELRVLRSLAGMVIPPNEEYRVPGADDDLIFADVITTAQGNETAVRQALQLAITVEQELGATLSATNTHAYDRLEGRSELAPLVAVILQCYYRDDRVIVSLGMEARPPFPKGFQVEQGDWSMLEAVQQRGKIWRDV
ncbi:MAG: hypothetical protein GKR90_13510 [Pseudomonadales bacterium]|nr:hypothetical protein [Pseudomonadales bacterium]